VKRAQRTHKGKGTAKLKPVEVRDTRKPKTNMSAITALISKLKPYTKVTGKPTASDVLKLKKEKMRNAGLLDNPDAPSIGQVGMMMSVAEYAMVNAAGGKLWGPPECSPDEPRRRNGEEWQAFEYRLRKHDKKKEAVHVFNTGCSMMVKMFFEAFEDKYTKALCEDMIESLNLTPQQCYQFMEAKYGTWTSVDIEKNKKLLEEAWDERESIETLLERFDEAIEIGKASKFPIAMQDVGLAITKHIIGKSDFTRALDDINQVDPKDWNWADIKASLLLAEKGRAKNTMADKGYHNANAATRATKPEAGVVTPNQRRGGLQIENGMAIRKTTKYQTVVTYCHSCGWFVNGAEKAHDSKNCPPELRKPDHDEEATPTFRNNGNEKDFHIAKRYGNRKRKKGGDGNQDTQK
jgi:hypothetical protein